MKREDRIISPGQTRRSIPRRSCSGWCPRPAARRPVDAGCLGELSTNSGPLVWAVGAADSGSAGSLGYILGNLSKSFNYRAVATRDESSLLLSQYIRIQNLANEEYGKTEMWAGFGKEFLKPIGLNNRATWFPSSRRCRFQDLHCQPGRVRLPRRGPENCVPMHYVIKNDKASTLAPPPVPEGEVVMPIEGTDKAEGTTSSVRTGGSSPRSTTRRYCGSTWGWRRTSSSSAQ